MLSQSLIQKLKTYIGFAIKSGRIVIGTDNILLNNKLTVVLYDNTLSQNAVDKITKQSETKHFLLFCTQNTIQELTSKEGCKAIGIKKGTLAEQIINILENSNE